MNSNQIKESLYSFDIKNQNHIKLLTYFTLLYIGMYSLNFTGFIFSVVIGILYPIVKSYNALKNNSIDDIITVVKYWTFFGIVTFVELLFGTLLQTIPFYCMLKTILFGWAINYNGATYIYDMYLVPKIEKYDIDKVNEFIKIFSAKITEAISEFNKLKTH